MQGGVHSIVINTSRRFLHDKRTRRRFFHEFDHEEVFRTLYILTKHKEAFAPMVTKHKTQTPCKLFFHDIKTQVGISHMIKRQK